MAELLIKVKRDSLPDPTFQDGDVMRGFPDKLIKHTYAQHICHHRNAGFNSDGLRPADCLKDIYLSKVCLYKFVVLNTTQVKRITLSMLAEEVFSMHVRDYVQHAASFENHLIFGIAGKEHWYSREKGEPGNPVVSAAQVAAVWQEIEARTAYREADHTRWPFNDYELTKWLVLGVDDFDDDREHDLRTGIHVDTIETRISANPLLVSHARVGEGIHVKRMHYVDWKNLAGLTTGTKNKIESLSQKVDLRDSIAFQHSQIVAAKTL